MKIVSPWTGLPISIKDEYAVRPGIPSGPKKTRVSSRPKGLSSSWMASRASGGRTTYSCTGRKPMT
ncbi:hypothetical protein ACKS0A_01996 [Histoplasma ohiense]